MISRKEIDRRLRDSEGLYAVAAQEMLHEQAAEYQTLVDGVKEIIDGMPDNDNSINGCKLRELYKPFLPPPLLLSEKLDKLADENKYKIELPRELRQLADEARKMQANHE